VLAYFKKRFNNAAKVLPVRLTTAACLMVGCAESMAFICLIDEKIEHLI